MLPFLHVFFCIFHDINRFPALLFFYDPGCSYFAAVQIRYVGLVLVLSRVFLMSVCSRIVPLMNKDYGF